MYSNKISLKRRPSTSNLITFYVRLNSTYLDDVDIVLTDNSINARQYIEYLINKSVQKSPTCILGSSWDNYICKFFGLKTKK